MVITRRVAQCKEHNPEAPKSNSTLVGIGNGLQPHPFEGEFHNRGHTQLRETAASRYVENGATLVLLQLSRMIHAHMETMIFR